MPPSNQEEERELAGLALLPFLSASLQPTLLVPAAPFAVFAQQRPTLDRSSAGWSATRRRLDRNGRSSSQESEGEGAPVARPTREILQSLFQPVWTNEAWLRWNETENNGMEVDSRTKETTERRRRTAGLDAKELDDVCYVLLELVQSGDLRTSKRWNSPHNPTLELHIALLPQRSHFAITFVSIPLPFPAVSTPTQASVDSHSFLSLPSHPASIPSPNGSSSHPLRCDGDLWMDSINGRTEMGTFICQYPWREDEDENDSSLRHPRTWTKEMRSVVGCLLDSKFQCALFSGPDSRLIYNDAYREAISVRHPEVFNEKGATAWGENWMSVTPSIRQVLEERRSTTTTDHFLLLPKDGRLIESYFTFSYIPFCDSAGVQDGFINASFE